MDSSHKNPSLWQPPSALFPPQTPPPPPSIPYQFHSYDQSRQIDHHQDLPQKSAVSHSPALHVSYGSPSIPQPYCNFSCTESRGLSQSARVGYMEKRFDAGSERSYQLEYGHWDCSDGVFPRDLDSNSRSRDGFCCPGYARSVFGDVRVEESYRNFGQFNSESDEYCRSLRAGTGFGHGSVPFGATLHPDMISNSPSNGETGNQRWVVTPKDDYFHAEIEQDFDNGKRKGSDELNQTTKKPRQVGPQKKKKKPRQVESLLLLDTPRENDRSPRPALFNDKRLRGKEHSDYGSVEMQTVTSPKTLLSKDINVGASEFHLNQEVREKAPTYDKFSSSRVVESENSLSMVPINVIKHHTWHRKSNTSAYPLIAGKPKEIVQSSSTYVRKGNSLLRKPSPGSLGEAKTLKRHSRKCELSPGMDTIASGLPGSSSGEAADTDVRNGLKISDALIPTGYASHCELKQIPPMLESSNPIKMLYVTRKANQLVAASNIHGASSSKPPSGNYFKRSENQLFRNSESLASQAKSLPDAALDSQTGENMVPKGSSNSTFSQFAVVRPFNCSKFSSVWTPKEPLSRKASKVNIPPQRIVPQPVPWKRATYWRSLMNPASVLRNRSFSTFSRKLLMMRRRHEVYRRSTNEYSLKKSSIVRIGGSHLIWSKSIVRDLKKPEFQSDVESSRSGSHESGKDIKKSSVPKRMVMGNDKSVWIRNGKQLVRDPKKRTCALANEVVRWSRHNVQLRLAKKRNYCQFFTRFGKCNKDDGKCPYIHDPSKIAVCTKFLSGSCANPDCKLTHKVAPESMPDCYYFLQGLCNNESCPYRHVHVHQNAATCEGFLRGYCSDGGECRKKHTYTCQVFEATGICPQGSECKLHHRKNLSQGIKRKRASESLQKNARGRYFGSLHKDLPESEPMLVNDLAIDGSVFGEEGPDFIRLDVNEEEARENMDSSTTESVSDDSEDQNSTDELIRPVRLMQ